MWHGVLFLIVNANHQKKQNTARCTLLDAAARRRTLVISIAICQGTSCSATKTEKTSENLISLLILLIQLFGYL